MIAATIRYVFPEGTDWDATRKLLQERAQLYVNMPGLISKVFLYDPQSREYGGNYIWEDREALDAFLASDMFNAAVARFGKPEIHVHEVAVHLDHGKLVIPEEQVR